MSYQMAMNRPASWWNDNWREGMPIGNGLHGALVYGSAANERIMLTHTTLWREARQPEMPDVSHVLPAMRELVSAGRAPEADRLILEELQKNGYEPNIGFPFPAADLLVSMPAKEGFSKYRRELLMDRAEVTVRYCDGQDSFFRRAFVSRTDDVLVVEANAGVQAELAVHAPDAIRSEKIELPSKAQSMHEGEWIFFRAEIDGIEHGAVARVVRGARTLVLCKVFTTGESKSQWPALKAILEKLPADYDTLMERHLPEHRRLFDACRFTLQDKRFTREELNRTLLDAAYDEGMPNALVERMWAYGRYLLVCGTAKGGLPCPLMGLWSGEYRPFWAFNMANINLEMIYWQALPGRLPELMLPVFDYYERHMDDLRENAQKLYGCRGIYLSAVSAPGGLKANCMAPHILNWTAGAGWIAQLYHEYWSFTGDHVFLVKRAIPFLREVASFYMDFLVWKGDEWEVNPSVSPENHTSSYRGGEELPDSMQTSINAAMDVAVIREVFSHLIEWGNMYQVAHGILPEDETTIEKAAAIGNMAESHSGHTEGISPAEVAEWKRFLVGAPAYRANEFGAPREWLHEDFPDRDLHRHQSHLYPVFPGLELARSDEKTLETYRQGGLRRMTVGLAHQTSWSLTQNANLMARVGDAENALKSLSLITRSTLMENLFTVHNDWRGMGICLDFPVAPFQIDANMGWTAAVQEMLLFSNRGRIDLLPALPEEWREGSIGPLATRAGVEVSLEWNRDGRLHRSSGSMRKRQGNNGGNRSLGNVTLKAIRKTAFKLYFPDKEFLEIGMEENESKDIQFQF